MFYTIKNMANDYNQPFLICDTVADVPTVPTSYAPGSKILVVSNGDKYILNNNNSWIKQPSGGGSLPEHDENSLPEHGVFFIDYDGSTVTAWASDEVASKTALPDNPTHDGLVAQGWNWTLADIQSHIANYPSADVYVGQMYETASGLTEMDITLTKATGLTVTCKMSGNKDWGDGTTDALTSHTYLDYGDYMITCDGTSVPAYAYSDNHRGYTAIRIGDGVTSIGEGAFTFCAALTNITIPDSVTSIGDNAFENCYLLTSITIPDGVTSIGNYAFGGCHSLTNITIPDGVTSIGEGAFSYCNSLTSVIIPDSVTSIGDNAFDSCVSLMSYDFSSATSVPTLGTDAFFEINGICKIIVPDALYDDWITADNWSDFTDYIYKASEV